MNLLFTKNLNSLKKGEKVLIIDDLLATGGTAEASARLVENIGGVIAGIGFVIKLTGFLHGREKFKKYSVLKLVQVEVHEYNPTLIRIKFSLGNLYIFLNF